MRIAALSIVVVACLAVAAPASAHSRAPTVALDYMVELGATRLPGVHADVVDGDRALRVSVDRPTGWSCRGLLGGAVAALYVERRLGQPRVADRNRRPAHQPRRRLDRVARTDDVPVARPPPRSSPRTARGARASNGRCRCARRSRAATYRERSRASGGLRCGRGSSRWWSPHAGGRGSRAARCPSGARRRRRRSRRLRRPRRSRRARRSRPETRSRGGRSGSRRRRPASSRYSPQRRGATARPLAAHVGGDGRRRRRAVARARLAERVLARRRRLVAARVRSRGSRRRWRSSAVPPRSSSQSSTPTNRGAR